MKYRAFKARRLDGTIIDVPSGDELPRSPGDTFARDDSPVRWNQQPFMYGTKKDFLWGQFAFGGGRYPDYYVAWWVWRSREEIVFPLRENTYGNHYENTVARWKWLFPDEPLPPALTQEIMERMVAEEKKQKRNESSI